MFPDRPWDPVSAWRLQVLYGPICLALRSIAAATDDDLHGAAGEIPRLKIVQVGGNPEVLRTFLEAEVEGDPFPSAERPRWEIAATSSFDAGSAPLVGDDVDLVVAIDWLECQPPSRREAELAKACRTARLGVVLVGAFAEATAIAGARAINDLHWAMTGTEHPTLGRALEFGFPNVALVRRWLERAFPVVDARPLETLAAWQLGETLASVHHSNGTPPSKTDIAAATAYPSAIGAADSRFDGGRVMIYGSRSFVRGASCAASAPVSDLSAIAIHQAVEAAAQRRALTRLTEVVGVERDREREEFRTTIGSLAAELRDLDGRAEYLAREVRQRDETIANLHLALTTEGERAEILSRELAECRQRAATADSRLAQLETSATAAMGAADAYHRFLDSRAGRLLRRYTRLKSALFGRR